MLITIVNQRVGEGDEINDYARIKYQEAKKLKVEP
jgi:hypothetical protein